MPKLKFECPDCGTKGRKNFCLVRRYVDIIYTIKEVGKNKLYVEESDQTDGEFVLECAECNYQMPWNGEVDIE